MAGMLKMFKELDDLLRGKKTEEEKLIEGARHIRLFPLVICCLVLGMVYGVFMGWYAVQHRSPPCLIQMLATSLKVPASFRLSMPTTR